MNNKDRNCIKFLRLWYIIKISRDVDFIIIVDKINIIKL